MATSTVEDSTSSDNGAVSRFTNFPAQLHYMLTDFEATGMTHIASFQPHGRAFKVHKVDVFVSTILPNWFRQSKYASFQRQLNIYGFKRITDGPDKNGYYHKKFLWGQPDLAREIPRLFLKGNGPRRSTSPSNEPNFYRMPQLAILPPSQRMEGPTTAVLVTRDVQSSHQGLSHGMNHSSSRHVASVGPYPSSLELLVRVATGTTTGAAAPQAVTAPISTDHHAMSSFTSNPARASGMHQLFCETARAEAVPRVPGGVGPSCPPQRPLALSSLFPAQPASQMALMDMLTLPLPPLPTRIGSLALELAMARSRSRLAEELPSRDPTRLALVDTRYGELFQQQEQHQQPTQNKSRTQGYPLPGWPQHTAGVDTDPLVLGTSSSQHPFLPSAAAAAAAAASSYSTLGPPSFVVPPASDSHLGATSTSSSNRGRSVDDNIQNVVLIDDIFLGLGFTVRR